MNKLVKFGGFIVFAIAAFIFGKNQENPFPKPAMQLGKYEYLCSTGQKMIISPVNTLSELTVLIDQNEFSVVRTKEEGVYQGEGYSLLLGEKDIQVSTDGASFSCDIL